VAKKALAAIYELIQGSQYNVAMKIYLVGGAVRDQLLGRKVAERDWVVVGATAEEMLAQGFKQVGKDFPVFLHPETHEEYALARTERKTAPGYHGFAVHADPDVTLQEDLLRRDLTVNALAEDENGGLIDYYNGKQDLDNRLLRHVSPAFAEDPVRVLRVARFAARYAHLGFKVAEETQLLMREMVESGEVDALVPERVWQELQKTLSEKDPSVFIEVLRDCGALKTIFPEIDRLFGVPQPEKYHPEIDTGIHTLLVLQQAVKLSAKPIVAFAALTHDLGRGTTPKDILPSHHGHEGRSVKLIKRLCERICVPKIYRELAIVVARYHSHIHHAYELKSSTVLKTLEGIDAFRRPERFEDFILTCTADSRGRTGLENIPYEQANYFRAALKAARSVDIKKMLEDGYSGKALAERIQKMRVKEIQENKEVFLRNL
jgi:tRNA nucleotidyltransferase (CCA-adding enzyme)